MRFNFEILSSLPFRHRQVVEVEEHQCLEVMWTMQASVGSQFYLAAIIQSR
jgi:hypothetical protein